ncbi:hypothetical protein RhiirC2_88009 [Rhizophagus irregularis]|uniref:Uncharacterized protein n=1 Tax=Rhizophagus irregularis TaxID=588596 RepID=A0A2N1MT76_9GLOM|nr:hypothetical protein RhiirC2_88009 [Rhizophagus irregularis]
MTTPAPTTPPVQPKKTKKSKTTGPVVLLPKGKFPTSVGDYELLDEATREKKEEVAQKTAEEEAKKKCPDTNTKPDIFQSTGFLQDDKIYIVNYPNNKKKESEKKDRDISDALNALNGTRKEGSTQDMPQAAIEALQRMFGKAPDQQRTRGSNYGKLDHDFTFPPRAHSTAGKSKETKEETADSSSKVNEDAKEVDLDEFEKKEQFTPSFISGSPLTDASKSDSDQAEDRKKKGKKEKTIDINGEVESSSYHQRKLRKPTSILCCSTAYTLSAGSIR